MLERIFRNVRQRLILWCLRRYSHAEFFDLALAKGEYWRVLEGDMIIVQSTAEIDLGKVVQVKPQDPITVRVRIFRRGR